MSNVIIPILTIMLAVVLIATILYDRLHRHDLIVRTDADYDRPNRLDLIIRPAVDQAVIDRNRAAAAVIWRGIKIAMWIALGLPIALLIILLCCIFPVLWIGVGIGLFIGGHCVAQIIYRRSLLSAE